MASQEERDNYFSLTLLLFRVGNQKLREYFKTWWPIVYQRVRPGRVPPPWNDTPHDAAEMKKIERRVTFNGKDQETKFNSGNTNDWDFSLLTLVLRYSSLQFVLPSSPESKALDDLKKIRNRLIANTTDAAIPNALFHTAWTNACNALALFNASDADFKCVQDEVKKPLDVLYPTLKKDSDTIINRIEQLEQAVEKQYTTLQQRLEKQHTAQQQTLIKHYERQLEESRSIERQFDQQGQKRSSADVQPVPPEILARGPKAEEAYKHALKEGKVQVYRGRIMLIGQHGVGKTSLKKSLLGLPFNPEEPSTVGVDVDPSSFSFDVDKVIEWKKLEDDSNNSFDDSVAKIMADRLSKSEEKLNTPTGLLLPEIPMPEISMPENRVSQASVNAGFDDINDVPGTKSENLPSKDVIEAGTKMEYRLPENVIESLIKYLSEKKIDDEEFSSEDKVQVSVWDFAGQQLYYASHPVFFSPRAVYVLVFNLSKNLNEDVEPCPQQGVYDTNLNNHEKQTNLESILSWLVSVHTTRPEENGKSKDGKNLPYVRPPVIIVGTHADCPFAASQEMEAMIQKSLDGKTYNDHVVRAFIAVDNKSEDKKGVQEVRDEVHKLFKTEPYIGEYVPVRWFMFEKVIKTLVDEKGINHLPLKDLEKVIFEVCHTEDKDEIAAMLNFYHDLGVIVKYGKSVVLNAEWLIDLFKRLITINRYNELNPRHRRYWKKLEDTGILDMELAEHVFDDAIKSKHSEIRDDILAIMERYALIAKFGTAEAFQYFVPAQLQSSPGDLLDAEPKESDPCELYLQFKDGFVPHGLYYCIVSKLIAWCSEKQYLKEPKLFRNVTQFAIGCSYEYELLLICRKPFIKVVLRSLQGERSPNFKPAFSVRKCLVDCLETVKNDCLGYRSISYDITVLCPSCSKGETKCKKHEFLMCRDDGCLHLLPFTNDEVLFCKEVFRNVQVPGLDEWYRDPLTAHQLQVEKFGRCENFALDHKHQVPVSDLKEFIRKMEHSIGAIIAIDKCGATCFRIGTKYVITNKHVIDDIERDYQWDSCHVDFNYKEQVSQPAASFFLKFAPNPVRFYSEDLDYAILELRSNGEGFPPSITDLGFKIAPCLTLIGHPAGLRKQIDVSCPIKKDIQQHLLKYDPSTITLMEEACNHPHQAAYDVSTFFKGASGSPGILMEKKLLVVLHRGGFENRALEFGILMSSVVKDVMTKIENAPIQNVLDDIFGGSTSSIFYQRSLR